MGSLAEQRQGMSYLGAYHLPSTSTCFSGLELMEVWLIHVLFEEDCVFLSFDVTQPLHFQPVDSRLTDISLCVRQGRAATCLKSSTSQYWSSWTESDPRVAARIPLFTTKSKDCANFPDQLARHTVLFGQAELWEFVPSSYFSLHIFPSDLI